MRITPQETQHIARLARLHLDTEQSVLMARQMDNILTYMKKLDELETADVEPTAHVLQLSNVWRPDEAGAIQHDRNLMFGQAPSFEDGFYIVPKVIE